MNSDSSKYRVAGQSRNRRVRLAVLAVLLGIIVATLPLWQTGPYRGSVSTIGPQSVPASGAYFDHVVVIMMENEGISNICGGNPPPCNGGNTPYLSSLANSYGIAQRYRSLITTSWPDYYGILGATLPSNCSKTNSGACYPPVGSQTNQNLVDRFEAAGVTWKAYMENQPLAAGCALSSSEPYVTEHNGFIAFQNIVSNPARCNQIVRANPGTCGTVVDCTLISDLNDASVLAPNFMWLTPSDCNDMRSWSGCSNGCTSDGSTTCVKAGDNYLKSLIPSILNSYTFTNTRAALFITFDEGMGYCPLNNSSEDCVYSVWAGPVAKTAYHSASLYNHYSLTKTIEVNWNLATLTSNDANANPMTEFFTTTSVGPSFSVAANPSSVTFPRGSGSSSTITLTSLNGFTGTVSLSANSSPSGLSLSLNPHSVTLSSGGTGSSTLSISSSTTGSYTVTITGTSGSQSHAATVSANVPDFSISSSPASITVSPGSSRTSSISLTSIGGFAGTVALSSTVSPTGPTASLGPSSVTLSSGSTATSTLTVSAPSSTPIGNYTVTVTGSSGSLSHSTTVLVAVKVAPDFSVSDNPSSLTLSRSSTSSSAITVASLNGFSGTVTLSVSGAGSGLRTSLSSSSLTLTSGGSATSTLTLRALKHAQLGTYTLTITATGAGLSHSTTLTVTVTA